MDKGSEQIIASIYKHFPQLMHDVDFKLTSKEDPNYNCIAWAFSFKDRIMWPGGSEYKVADGFHFWPDGIDDNDGADNFVKAFKLIGYNNCVSFEYEPGYQKIALYVEKGTTKCTHAARGLQNGKWTSKLGPKEDIQHGTPYFLESIVYGEVYCFMKRIFK